MLAGVDEIHQTMLSQVAALEDHSLEFLFSSKNHPYLNRDAITVAFEREWEIFRPFLEPEKQRRSVANLLFPDRPYDLKIMQELRYAFQTASVPSPIIALDLCIRAVLTLILDKYSREMTPQLIIELLNPYKLRTPEFLIIIKPIIHIIIDRNRAYNRIVKSHACEVLINNFEIETLFIYISCSPDLQEEEKQVLFQSLTAFQKIYRKLLELHVGIPEKDRISLRWFGVSFTQLKRQGEWRDSFSNMVRRFVQYLRQRNKRDAVNVGRFLVLRFNNEDILRVIHYEISRDPDLSPNKPLALFIFRQVFRNYAGIS